MIIYIFGNGNLSFQDFMSYYQEPLEPYLNDNDVSFIVGDFRGVDTLVMELLKTNSENVTIYHLFEAVRYLPDKYKTKVGAWKLRGGFRTDEERDNAMIACCTHFLGVDFNSSQKRESGTSRNLQKCLEADKTGIGNK
jgi:hypothetical protein